MPQHACNPDTQVHAYMCVAHAALLRQAAGLQQARLPCHLPIMGAQPACDSIRINEQSMGGCVACQNALAGERLVHCTTHLPP